MFSFLSNLVVILKEANTAFSSGEYFQDTLQFVSSGVNDKYLNLFYIRHINKGTSKFRYNKSNQNLKTVSSTLRLVVQLNNDFDKNNSLLSIISQLENVNQSEQIIDIISYSDDTEEIYKAETGKTAVMRDFFLLSIDFTVSIEDALFNHCVPECISKC